MPMRPIDVEPLADGQICIPQSKSQNRKTPAPPPVAIDWRSEVGPELAARVARLAAPIAVRPPSPRHELFLALSGALLGRGVEPGELPALIRAVAIAANDPRVADRHTAARTTASRKATGLKVAGWSRLQKLWPEVAAAVDDAFPRPELPEPPRQNIEAQKAAEELEQAIRNAPDGLSVIAAACGLGKTRAAERIAIERALLQASRGTHTSISVPTHKLALEIYGRFVAASVLARRYFGPLSLMGADGRPECRFHSLAWWLVQGRQSMQWELCLGRGKKPCPYKATCKAFGGAEGPTDARITVGPHQLIGDLDGAAGTTGLLVIDEPPSLVVTEVLTAKDLEEARACGHFFGHRYKTAMRPVLRALAAWVAGEAELDEVYSVSHAVQRTAQAASAFPLEVEWAIEETHIDCTGDTGIDIVEAARAAHYPDAKSSSPPLKRDVVERLRFDIPRAKQLSKASKTLYVVHHALASEANVTIRVVEKDGHRVALVTHANEAMERALNRAGQVIVTDANAELHLDAMRTMVGYEPPLKAFDAGDGAAIQRTHIRTLGATRRSWFAHGRLVPEAGFIGAVRAAVDWILEGQRRKVGIITMRTLRFALEAALGRDIGNGWEDAGQTPEVLEQLKTELAPVLTQLAGTELVFGHYGAIRGLNSMSDIDAVVTIGDPWSNMDDARNTAGFLGLAEDAWEPRYRAHAKAELEQAQGRLRVIYRQRPGRACHIGALLPSGSAWRSKVEVRQLADRVGRPANGATMTVDEVARIVEHLGGVRATARALGCGKSTVERYVSGETGTPMPVAIRLKQLATGVSGTGADATQEKETAIGFSGTPNNVLTPIDAPSGGYAEEHEQYSIDANELGDADYVPDIPRKYRGSLYEEYPGQPRVAPTNCSEDKP